MAADIVLFGALNLTLNHVKCVYHSPFYFDMKFASTNYFISVPLPLCTKLNGPQLHNTFRKEISIHKLSLGWKLLNPNETLKDRCLILERLEKECCQMNGLWHSWIAKSCDLWQTVDLYVFNHWESNRNLTHSFFYLTFLFTPHRIR